MTKLEIYFRPISLLWVMVSFGPRSTSCHFPMQDFGTHHGSPVLCFCIIVLFIIYKVSFKLFCYCYTCTRVSRYVSLIYFLSAELLGYCQPNQTKQDSHN